MKHIDKIYSFDEIKGKIKDGDLSPNFLVKTEDDEKIHFSNALGYYIVDENSGQRYNMYENGDVDMDGKPVLEADFSSPNGFHFSMYKNGELVTTEIDCNAQIFSPEGTVIIDESFTANTDDFELYWEYDNDVSWEVEYYPGEDRLSVIGGFEMTDEEYCEWRGGFWDGYECHLPSCEDQGLCDDGEGNCVECESSSSSESGDGEGTCNENPYNWWDGETCHSCLDEWESLGYSSPEECAIDKRGDVCGEQGLCLNGIDGCTECEGDGEPTCEEQGLCDDGEGNCVECGDESSE